jgi:hypothetical protein
MTLGGEALAACPLGGLTQTLVVDEEVVIYRFDMNDIMEKGTPPYQTTGGPSLS